MISCAYMDDCLFCKIVRGEIPSQTVYEDDTTIAFLDIRPTNPGHTLVVPKTHAQNIFDISESDWLATMATARTLAPVIKDAVAADGLNVHVNNEPAAGQVIFHAHVHLIPRFENDGYELWHGEELPDEEMVRIRDSIVKKLP